MAIIGIVTNVGVQKARDAQNDEGFKIFPTGFSVSRVRSTLDPNRTTPNSGVWYSAAISSRVAVSDNTVKFLCTVPVNLLPAGSIDTVREIYLFGRDSNNDEFLFAIGQTTQDIIYDSSASVTLELEVSLTNADLNSTLVFQYTQATELSEHVLDPNAHPEMIAAMNKGGLFLPSGGVPFAYAGQTFDEKAEFEGTAAQATVGSWVFRAKHNGPMGNAITLAFDGVKTADQVVLAWNAANPTNDVEVFSGDGSSVPPPQNITLSGGTLAVGHLRLVYRAIDGFYKLAVADGSLRSRVVGIADTSNRIVRSAGFLNFVSGYPAGTELFLSPTNPGMFTDIPSEVKVALVVSPSTILLSSFGGGTATAGQNFDTIVTDVPGFKKYAMTQDAITETPDGGFIFVDKLEALSYPLDLQGKALSFVFNGPKTGWFRYLGQVEKIHLGFSAIPSSGTWRMEWAGQESVDFAYNSAASEIEAAFNSFPGHTGVAVTGNYTTGFMIEFVGNGAYPLPTFSGTGRDEIQRISFSDEPDDGTIRLEINGQQTLNIPWNSTPAEIESWVEQLTNINDVEVTGSFAHGYFEITFRNLDGKQDWPTIAIANNSLALGATPVSAVVATIQEGQFPAANLRSGSSPVVITPTLIQAGLPLGPDVLLQVAADNTRFLGQGVIRDFETGIDLNGKKNVDIEVQFENTPLPIINTDGGLKPATDYHRFKSFGIAARNTIVVGNSSTPGDFNSLPLAIAAAATGDRLVVVADQMITAGIVIDKEIEVEFVNSARLVLGSPIAGAAVYLGTLTRTKHMRVVVSYPGSYGTIVEMDGIGGHHLDLYVECSGNATVVDTAFKVAPTASGIFCDGLIQIGTATVTNVLGNASGIAHNVQIRDRSNGIVHDTFNRRPPVQESLVGIVDGVNDEFLLSEYPASQASVLVMVNSLPRFPGTHYDLVGRTVRFRTGSIPVHGQDVAAYYLPTGLVTAPPTAKAGSIEAVASSGGSIVEAVKRLKFVSGITATQDPSDPNQLLLEAEGGGGGGGSLTAIAVNIQPDLTGNRSVGTAAKAWRDIYLKDKTTSATYRLEIDNGILQAVEVN